jgi:hypothetical protein
VGGRAARGARGRRRARQQRRRRRRTRARVCARHLAAGVGRGVPVPCCAPALHAAGCCAARLTLCPPPCRPRHAGSGQPQQEQQPRVGAGPSAPAAATGEAAPPAAAAAGSAPATPRAPAAAPAAAAAMAAQPQQAGAAGAPRPAAPVHKSTAIIPGWSRPLSSQALTIECQKITQPGRSAGAKECFGVMELEVMKFVAYCGGLTIRLRVDDMLHGGVDRCGHGRTRLPPRARPRGVRCSGCGCQLRFMLGRCRQPEASLSRPLLPPAPAPAA